MALRIICDDDLSDRIRFGYSPAIETCLALHCLSYPEHHPEQMPWITEMRERLPQGLYKRLIEFGQGASAEWIGPARLFEPGSFAPLELEVTRLRAATPADVRESLRSRQSLNLDEGKDAELLAEVANDTVAWRDYACDLLEAFWPYFISTWQRLSRELAEQLTQLYARQHEGVPTPEILAALSEQIEWREEDGQVVIRRVRDADVAASRLDAVMIQPSYFSLPHLWVQIDGQLAITAGVATGLGPHRLPPTDDLAASLKVLADPVRLRIIALLLEANRSTQELAGMLNLTAPAVSRHLRKLQGAGIARRVGRTARGMYVKYGLDPDAGDTVGRQVTELFGQASERKVNRAQRVPGHPLSS